MQHACRHTLECDKFGRQVAIRHKKEIKISKRDLVIYVIKQVPCGLMDCGILAGSLLRMRAAPRLPCARAAPCVLLKFVKLSQSFLCILLFQSFGC